MFMETLGRGGEGGDGQKIRDDILNIMHKCEPPLENRTDAPRTFTRLRAKRDARERRWCINPCLVEASYPPG